MQEKVGYLFKTVSQRVLPVTPEGDVDLSVLVNGNVIVGPCHGQIVRFEAAPVVVWIDRVVDEIHLTP